MQRPCRGLERRKRRQGGLHALKLGRREPKLIDQCSNSYRELLLRVSGHVAESSVRDFLHVIMPRLLSRVPRGGRFGGSEAWHRIDTMPQSGGALGIKAVERNRSSGRLWELNPDGGSPSSAILASLGLQAVSVNGETVADQAWRSRSRTW